MFTAQLVNVPTCFCFLCCVQLRGPLLRLVFLAPAGGVPADNQAFPPLLPACLFLRTGRINPGGNVSAHTSIPTAFSLFCHLVFPGSFHVGKSSRWRKRQQKNPQKNRLQPPGWTDPLVHQKPPSRRRHPALARTSDESIRMER